MSEDDEDAYRSERALFLKGLGENIRRLRNAIKPRLSQEELADNADLHRTEIGRLERGLTDPHATTLVIVANVLDTTVDDLVKGLPAPKHRKRRR
jgi:transcriptional regulator with XRE-family HTH domain